MTAIFLWNWDPKPMAFRNISINVISIHEPSAAAVWKYLTCMQRHSEYRQLQEHVILKNCLLFKILPTFNNGFLFLGGWRETFTRKIIGKPKALLTCINGSRDLIPVRFFVRLINTIYIDLQSLMIHGQSLLKL